LAVRQLLAYKWCLIKKYFYKIFKKYDMKGLKNKLAIGLIWIFAGLLGVVKGDEAKNKWVFKIKNKYVSRKQVKENKLIALRGGVMLDDIELAAYHK
jgi:hypothetical protein